MLLYQLLSRLLNAVLKSAATLSRIENSLKAIADEQAIQREALSAIQDEQAESDEKIERILTAVEPMPAVGFRFSVDVEGQIEEGATQINMTNSQKATATIQPVDKKGNPAPIDGVPVWASSDETIITVTPAADGLSAVVAAVGPLGSAKVSVSGDADLSPDTAAPIFGSVDISVTQGLAVGFKIELGAAEEQG